MTPVLDVTGLTVTFATDDGPVPAVRGLDVRVEAGDVVALVGESGSGKSATAMAVVGLLPEDARVGGSVRFRGEELLGLGDAAMSRIRGDGIGTVFQDPMSALTPVFTVGDQIAEALMIPRRSARRDGLTRRDARARAVELLDLVGIDRPDRRARAFPHQLSGGERQRVVIAIAIARDPDLLICDEPTTALDVTVQAQILDVLRTAREVTGAAVLIIIHDLGVVAETADRAVVMYAGRAVETADTAALFAAPRMPYTVGLLGSVPRLDAAQGTRLIPIGGAPPTPGATGPGCPFSSRCPLCVEDCLTAEPPLHPVDTAVPTPAGVRGRAAHEAACLRTDEVARRSATEIYGVTTTPHAAAVGGDGGGGGSDGGGVPPVVLAVRDLRRTYRAPRGVLSRRRGEDVAAVAGISFELPRGRTLGIVGESGSGKSTTVTEILELSRPQHGTIEVLGHDVAALDAATRASLRGELQVVFQDPGASLDPRMPVSDVVAEPLRAAGRRAADIGPRVAELLARVGLRATDAHRYPGEFSGGQQQRIGIARALALRPTILALDEPVSALDVSVQAGIINLLLDLQDSDGLSFLFVSHDLAVVRHLAHRVAVMRRGVIVEQGDADDVFSAPRHDYTRALLAAVPRTAPR